MQLLETESIEGETLHHLLKQIKLFVQSGDRRVRLVQALTGSRECIIKQAGEQLFQNRPNLVSPGEMLTVRQ